MSAETGDAAPQPPAPSGTLARMGAWFKAKREQLREHFAEFGGIAIATYFAIFFLTWAGFVVAIRMGVEVDGAAENTGTIGAAYVATKLTQPLRIIATLALTPAVAGVWFRISGRKRESKSDA
ncbi:MAG: hypothetical protein U0168_23915 [Nannocystaceae bacterium]|jgi:hypothetical protein